MTRDGQVDSIRLSHPGSQRGDDQPVGVHNFDVAGPQLIFDRRNIPGAAATSTPPRIVSPVLHNDDLGAVRDSAGEARQHPSRCIAINAGIGDTHS